MISIEWARTAGRSAPRLLAAGLLCLAPMLARALTLEEAERYALEADPSVRSVEARQQALEEQAVAEGALPDPMLQAGMMSVPVDSWRLDQEPMTQVVVGISQDFPRGKTRSLRTERLRERSGALDRMAADQRLRIRLSVRENYVDVVEQVERSRINAEAVRVFADLATITEDYYATGRAQQQDVLRAAVELVRIEDRGAAIGQAELAARARLATWIGPRAQANFADGWPELPSPAPLEQIRAGLPAHPRVAAQQQEVQAADAGIELARQRYKPGFGVDLAYGARSIEDPLGRSMPDLFTVMVKMDLPLFHANRQDRYLAAAVAESAAAQFDRDDLLRRMESEAALYDATRQTLLERLDLYEQRLLPDAEFNAAAAFTAYQAAVDDLATLLRARITEFELRLDFVQLQAESLRLQARLAYLQGERE